MRDWSKPIPDLLTIEVGDGQHDKTETKPFSNIDWDRRIQRWVERDVRNMEKMIVDITVDMEGQQLWSEKPMLVYPGRAMNCQAVPD